MKNIFITTVPRKCAFEDTGVRNFFVRKVFLQHVQKCKMMLGCILILKYMLHVKVVKR